MLLFLVIIDAFIYVSDNQFNHIYNSGNYSMRIRQHNAFFGDTYDDLKILVTVREVQGGFNLTFHSRKSALDFNVYANEMTITFKKSTTHMGHMVHMTLELHGGVLDDVSMDEIEEKGDLYTIVRIRLVGNDENIACASGACKAS